MSFFVCNELTDHNLFFIHIPVLCLMLPLEHTILWLHITLNVILIQRFSPRTFSIHVHFFFLFNNLSTFASNFSYFNSDFISNEPFYTLLTIYGDSISGGNVFLFSAIYFLIHLKFIRKWWTLYSVQWLARNACIAWKFCWFFQQFVLLNDKTTFRYAKYRN